MELCYIWVENFKGFENQGFNLAGDAEFHFDNSNYNLTRAKKKNYIPNFFGSNIINITGIIGRNASGKTNILELINYIIDGANTIINKPFLAIFNKGGEYLIYIFKTESIELNFHAKIINYKGNIPDFDSIYFSNIYDGRRSNFGKRILNISNNELFNVNFFDSSTRVLQKSLQKQINFIEDSNNFSILEDVEKKINQDQTLSIKPIEVILTSPVWSTIEMRIKSVEYHLLGKDDKIAEIREFINLFRKKITDNKSSNSFKYYTAFHIFIDFLIWVYEPRPSYPRNVKKTYNIDDVNKLKGLSLPVKKDDVRVDELYKYLIGAGADFLNENYLARETFMFLRGLEKFNFIEEIKDAKEDLGSYGNRRIQFTLTYTNEVGVFLKEYLKIIKNERLSYNIEWVGLSSGHKAYLNLFSSFSDVSDKIKRENLIITIDEGDLYFHPKWQTEFLYKLIYVLPKLFKKPCQIILTSHSPFIVSDLPNQNLIFLDKTIENKLVVKNAEKKTFGGNIGDLYLDAFFMYGRVISEFAASKIRGILSKVKNKIELTSDDYALIDEIGDEIIKLQINKLISDTNSRQYKG